MSCYPSGYKCNGVEILRESEETTEDLQKRCEDAVPLSENESYLIFKPLVSK